jgi:hypothetical protein
MDFESGWIIKSRRNIKQLVTRTTKRDLNVEIVERFLNV